MKNLLHVAGRIFNQPLLIQHAKLEAILGFITARMDGNAAPKPEAISGDRRERKPYAVTPEGIAVISIVGPLVQRASGDFLSGGPTTYSQIEDEFLDAATDPAIKGILLEMDSPGGEVGGLFALAESIYSQRGSKPIYSVVNDQCFSAAYAIASSTERIYTTQTGGVGSVGVIAVHCDQSALDEKVGLKFTTIFAGSRKADFNPHAPLSDAAFETLQAEIDRLYGLFTSMVGRNRGMSVDDVRKTEAGLFFGEKGVDVGFADKIGTFRDALQDLAAVVSGQPKSSGMAASAAAEITTKEGTMPESRADAEAMPKHDPADPDHKDDEEEDHEHMETKETTQGTAATVAAAPIAATAEEVIDLCVIAGQPIDLAQKLIGEKLTLADVRKRLIEAKAAAQAPPTRSTLSPKSGAVSGLLSQAAELAKQQPTLSKEQHFARMLRANPSAYEQYLAENPAQTGRAA